MYKHFSIYIYFWWGFFLFFSAFFYNTDYTVIPGWFPWPFPKVEAERTTLQLQHLIIYIYFFLIRNGVGSVSGFSELLPVGQFHLRWKFLQLKNQYFTWGSARQRAGGPLREPHQLSTVLQPVLVSSNFRRHLTSWVIAVLYLWYKTHVEGTKPGLWDLVELGPDPCLSSHC